MFNIVGEDKFGIPTYRIEINIKDSCPYYLEATIYKEENIDG